ncbi:MAG TPA: hypothetical protein DEB31_01995 [Clostridiales bacterium]|nr:hypothetical protein [Clostridiales bacterium]
MNALRRCPIKKDQLYPLLALAIYFLVALILERAQLLSGLVNTPGDGMSYLNIKSLQAQSFLESDPALWNRFSMLGVPFAADVQTSFF